MVEIEIMKTLPDCELIRVLAEKVGHRSDTSFNVFSKLDDFCRRISGEVRQINELFPEFTPHDEEYHIKKLFFVADTVLGRERFEAMNSTELFVLAVSLYGHDWGMAVGLDEKEYIITGKIPEEKNLDDLWVLPDERSRFKRFARDKQLAMKGEVSAEDITIEIWRDYVRETHALRSGERVRRFFEEIDGGVADAASRVCEGHWLSFEALQDYDSYPPNFSVARENVNLRALAVYLRLIDLLDLAEDRTPYVIWKFVAPRDPQSKMEWKKHRALRPVTCPPYLNGRVIRVDGSTDHHEVYAALEDLRIYCEDQLRGCNDLLAQMYDPNHKLDLYHIDWRVAAKGFKKTSIRFEFDRNQMFRILGDEIYQGDPYVFLRELLQNSIDAIRMRRNIIEKHAGYEPGNLGVIRVNVEHQDDGDAIVTWTDDGIGMDEYIVKNYLAVAGKSYYISSDFEREGLEMDPISRFGIGILSCFMVADRIEIDTYKDPMLPPQSGPLKIKIPDPSRQFRIESLPHVISDIIGTTVRVFVKASKIPDSDEKYGSFKPLKVTEYLSTLAGFVEFPIVISEESKKTIILHPDQDPNAARERFGPEFKIHQRDLSYPLSEAIVPQDLHNARELLREEHFNIRSDLGLEDYEGSLTYLVPINDEVDISYWSENVLVRGKPSGQMVRPSFNWRKYGGNLGNIGLSRSSTHNIKSVVYRDGILLPTESSPESYLFDNDFQLLPSARLVVNLEKKKFVGINLARDQILGGAEQWYKPILKAHSQKVLEKFLNELLSLEPLKRFYQMIRICLYHNISAKELWNMFPQDRWPVLFLEAGGRFSVLELGEVRGNNINMIPDNFDEEYIDWKNIIYGNHCHSTLVDWTGERVLIRASSEVSSMQNFIADRLMEIPFEESHRFTFVRFLEPPWEGDPPLIQRVFCPVDSSEGETDIKQIFEKAVSNPILLTPVERNIFIMKTTIPTFIEFPPPFDKSFAYGWRLLNLKNPIVQILIQVIAAYELSKIEDTLSPDKIGQLQDKLGFLEDAFWSELNIEASIEKLKTVLFTALDMDLLDIRGFEDMIPTVEDFVPGSIRSDPTKRDCIPTGGKKMRPFGKPL
jgi:hypothetical protein